MLTLLYAVRYGVGVLVGLGLGLVLGMAWNLLVPALAEWFMETFVDRGRRPSETLEPIREVLVSDLHIDSWNYEPQKEYRAKNFVEFLGTIRADDRIDGFVLNGDLMDIPLFAGRLTDEQRRLMLEVGPGKIGPDQGVIARNYLPILRDLFSLERPNEKGERISRVIFQSGNHDIGVVGLRYVLGEMPDFLPGVHAGWSPQILLMGSPREESYARRFIYIEHGQEYDPFLWLYLRYAVLDLLRGGHLHREAHFVRAMQRHGQTGLGQSSKGSGRKSRIRAEAATSGTVGPDLEEPPVSRERGDEWDYEKDKHTVGEWLLLRRYRFAARMAFWKLPNRRRTEVRTVMFGHTHKPDRYVFPSGRVYINSGDWAGYSTDQSYCLIHTNGYVSGPYQWEDAVTFHDRHGA